MSWVAGPSHLSLCLPLERTAASVGATATMVTQPLWIVCLWTGAEYLPSKLPLRRSCASWVAELSQSNLLRWSIGNLK